MNLKIPLPANLPPGDFDVEIQLRRIPEKSGIVKPRLHAAGGPGHELAPVYIYGRGVGSAATEKVHLLIHVEAALLRQADTRGDKSLSIAVEDLAGAPIPGNELDVESVTLKPSSP